MFYGLTTIYRLASNFRADEDTGKLRIFLTLVRLYTLSWLNKNNRNKEVRFHHFRVQTFDLPTLIGLYQDIFVKQLYRFGSSGPDVTIIDGGANIGMATLFFKSRFPDSRLIAFEPNTAIFSVLKSNIAANGLAIVELVNAVLGASDGFSDFFTPVKQGAINGTVFQKPGFSKTSVQSAKLSSYLRENTLNLIKLDIEGSEFDVIDELISSDTLKLVTELCVEVHCSATRDERLVIALLSQRGFGHEMVSADSYDAVERNVVVHFFR